MLLNQKKRREENGGSNTAVKLLFALAYRPAECGIAEFAYRPEHMGFNSK